MNNKTVVYLLISTKNTVDTPEGCIKPEKKVEVAFTQRGSQETDIFIETLLKLSNCAFTEWEETKEVLESRKNEIVKFLKGEIEEFNFEDKIYSFITIPLDEEGIKEEEKLTKFPYVYVKYDDDYIHPEIAYASLEKGRQITSQCVPLAKKGSWPGLSFEINMPFAVKDKKLHMFDEDGVACGKPVERAIPLIGGYYLVNESDSESFIVNCKGVKVSDTGVYVYGPANGYCVFSKDGKYGFITEWGDFCNPKFDDIGAIDMGAPVQVKLGDTWGYVTTDNEFVTEDQQEEECYDIYCGAGF